MPLQLPQLPNFQTNIPQADPLQTYGKMLQLKALQGQQQLLPLQVEQEKQKIQSQQLQNEMQQMQLTGQKALAEYWKNPGQFQSSSDDFKHNDALAGMLGIAPDDPLMGTVRAQIKAGVPAPMAFAEAKSTLQVRQEWSKATQEQQSVLKNGFEQLREIAAPILAEKDANKKQKLIEDAAPGLARWASFDPSLKQVIPQLHAGNFDAFANRIGAEEKSLDFTKKQVEKTVQEQSVVPEGGGLSPKNQDELNRQVAYETNPKVIAAKERVARAEAQGRMDAAQGDPNVTGQLLANGSLTMADLKSRGLTPKFIQQATLAAQKISPGYNPADEMIAEHVAKSPAANQFFGSANSLIEKGGTLDQLTNLGKNIPQHDFPVLNTVDDWQKLATGKGPLAAYAATALGVADDYGKVMGGGTASDHARDAALKLFSQASSPEQRAEAIKATRAAVLSQRSGRIGKNQFLQRQYGAEVGGEEQGGGDFFSKFGGKAKQQ